MGVESTERLVESTEHLVESTRWLVAPSPAFGTLSPLSPGEGHSREGDRAPFSPHAGQKVPKAGEGIFPEGYRREPTIARNVRRRRSSASGVIDAYFAGNRRRLDVS